MLGAGITAFYMSRLFFMTFHGEKRWTEDDQHPHESPLTMTVPMMMLALGSAFLGLILGRDRHHHHWLAPVVGEPADQHPVIPADVLMVVTLVLVIAGAFLAWRRYGADVVPEVAPKGSALTRAARSDLYQDARQRGPVHASRHAPDPRAGLRRRARGRRRGRWPGGPGRRALARGCATLQTGFVRSYALTMLAGVVVILGALWVIQ